MSASGLNLPVGSHVLDDLPVNVFRAKQFRINVYQGPSKLSTDACVPDQCS